MTSLVTCTHDTQMRISDLQHFNAIWGHSVHFAQNWVEYGSSWREKKEICGSDVCVLSNTGTSDLKYVKAILRSLCALF